MKLESLKSVSILEIYTNKISYNKKTNVFSVEILNFMFVGNYKKSVRVSQILDDIYDSFGDVIIERDNIYFLDANTRTKVHGNTKLKNIKIKIKSKIEIEKKKPKAVDKRKAKKEDLLKFKEEAYDEEELDELVSEVEGEKMDEYRVEEKRSRRLGDADLKDIVEEREEVKAKKKEKSLPPPAPGGGAPSRPSTIPASTAPPPPPSDALAGPGAPPPKPMPAPSIVAPEEPQPIVYDINMGLQYYSVMMEQRSYLFYVYFSHKELKIVDEEGKVVYETTIKIVTTKKEPPILDLRIEGEGFEVHPLFGKVEVKKEAINPPVMIFSILPTKSTKKNMKKKEFERRYLNAYVDFEGKTISHTILSIIVQPKFFRLDIGPIHLNLSKKTALIISFISILVAGLSLVWIFFSIDSSSNFTDLLGGIVPGLGSIIFIAIFLITLFKEGIYPLKEKISGFLNFDQAGVLIK